MFRIGVITAAFLVAICMPWLIVKTDINTALHTLPGGWTLMLFHSMVVIHTPQNHPIFFSLKDVVVAASILVLVGLIGVAAVRQRRDAARGFEIHQQPDGATEPSKETATPSQT